jgi:glutaredoxin 3
MAEIILYTDDFCGFCKRAKALFQQKGVDFKEINLGQDWQKRKDLEKQTGMRTVPIIFIQGKCIGGYHELVQLEASGELDRILQIA